MDYFDTLFNLGENVFEMATWAILPGIILPYIVSFWHREKKPTPQMLEKSEKDIVMILAVLFCCWRLGSFLLYRDLNYYEVLDLNFPSETSKIKKAYRKLSLKFHPDKGGSEEDFNLVREAYEILSDVNLRRVYNRLGKIDFTCPDCVSFIDWWSNNSVVSAIFNYFFSVLFLTWSTWSHSRAWIRPWLRLSLFLCFCIELVFVFSDDAPIILSLPHFEVVELVRHSYFVILSAACLVSNYWPGDNRCNREIINSIEMECGKHMALLNHLTMMNQVIMEDDKLRTKLKQGYDKRAGSMGLLLSSPDVLHKFSQESLKSCGLKPTGPDGQPIVPNILSESATQPPEAKKDL